jgi:hypothetical protein
MINETRNLITLTCINEETGETICLKKHYYEGCTWNEISEMYYRFLSAMGYHLASEDVGADFSTQD